MPNITPSRVIIEFGDCGYLLGNDIQEYNYRSEDHRKDLLLNLRSYNLVEQLTYKTYATKRPHSPKTGKIYNISDSHSIKP